MEILQNTESVQDLSKYTETIQDLANHIQFKNLDISTPEKLDFAFRDYLINGSVSHWYLQKADNHQKNHFIKKLKSSVDA